MKIYFKIGIGLALIFILVLGVSGSAGAVFFIPEVDCTSGGGTWDGPNQNTGHCITGKLHAWTTFHCPGFDWRAVAWVNGVHAGEICSNSYPAFDPAAYVLGRNYGMRRKGYCKLISLPEEGYLGGTISATVKGAPKHLKLKADGKTYTLPVVPGSVVANGDGTYTAQFYTIDPSTGQALVPAGEYSARCHGSNGSKDGGSSNTIEIGY